MPFVEVFVPKGALSGTQQAAIRQRLVAEVMDVEGAPDTPEARSISWLVMHEMDAWSVGGHPVGSEEAPRFVVRLAVPAGSLDDVKRELMMARVNDLLVEIDGSDRLRRSPDAWVHINEVPEGNWGAFGRVVSLPDIAAYISRQAS
jgi:phenylpyruvate tautomerase PptA (4-oxalocrotonate tautomerase family)